MFFSPYNFPRDFIQMKLFLNMGDGEIWTKRGIADFVGANKMILEYIFFSNITYQHSSRQYEERRYSCRFWGYIEI